MKQTTEHTSNAGGQKAQDSKKRKFYFLAGLGLLAGTALTFFGIYYWKKHKTSKPEDSKAPEFKAQKPASTPPKPKTGTKPPQGSATQTTAKKTAEKPQEPSLFEPKDLADKMRSSIIKANFLMAYTSLKQIRNTTDYKNVNAEFSKLKTGFTTQTIVNALLSKFKLEVQRKLLFQAFKRIGLTYNGTKWTLGATEEKETQQLITISPTKVWKDPRTSVPVPSHMVLGREVCKRGNFTLFEHAKTYFLVESKAVKSIHH